MTIINDLNKRQNQIIDILLNNSDYVTASDLSVQLSVSTKTIYRDIQRISRYLKNYTLTKKENLGYLLTKPNAGIEGKEQIIINCTKERRLNLLLHLLAISPMKTSIQKLSERYFVSQSSIINDFKYIESHIEAYNLRLLKHNSGTFIHGHQLSINRLLSVIVQSYLKQLMAITAYLLLFARSSIPFIETYILHPPCSLFNYEILIPDKSISSSSSSNE